MFLLRDNILLISNITAGCVPSAIRTFTMAEFDDPLESCLGREGGPEGPKLGIFTLTPAGVRALLGRKRVRSRPLLKLTCCGCGRSSWDNCRFVPTDLIEWAPQCMTTCKLLLRLNVVFFEIATLFIIDCRQVGFALLPLNKTDERNGADRGTTIRTNAYCFTV